MLCSLVPDFVAFFGAISLDSGSSAQFVLCVCHYHFLHTKEKNRFMRTNIDIDDALMIEAQRASGHATKKATVEEALRLLVKLRRQKRADKAFGRYRWRGDLARSRRGRSAA